MKEFIHGLKNRIIIGLLLLGVCLFISTGQSYAYEIPIQEAVSVKFSQMDDIRSDSIEISIYSLMQGLQVEVCVSQYFDFRDFINAESEDIVFKEKIGAGNSAIKLSISKGYSNVDVTILSESGEKVSFSHVYVCENEQKEKNLKSKINPYVRVDRKSMITDAVLIIVLLFWLALILFDRNSSTKWKVKQVGKLICTYTSIILFFCVIFCNTIVASGSMEPTLMTGDFAIYNRLAYKFSDVKRGDIVSFWSWEFNEMFSKRVIAVGGDEISFSDGVVFINGCPIDESEYLSENVKTYCSKTFYVPEGYVFVMGDNREDSHDSRDFFHPFISKEDIIGEFIVTIPREKLFK